jgi:hypothetical protein
MIKKKLFSWVQRRALGMTATQKSDLTNVDGQYQ